ncbi:tyrosine-type recombinase/integrase [Microbacterium sp. ASV49]|uniref:Tyrosine-type recombinase/integrase n=1 Tax=Microbacterium candidum TaxID=3041922 RepID=A0ABT7MWN5_9MICO|nr:tyrosine-type recombinase/integrase [Microbacterium sp. ASV49]MDL9978858.1 tyrosine-type recombinase/integrase [Microbacterium sp. ASV49]
MDSLNLQTGGLSEVLHAWASAIDAFAAAQLASNIARTSVYARRQHLGHLAKRIMRAPWDVTSDDLAGYMAQQDWMPETRRGRRTTFAAFYGWAVETGRVAADPVAGIKRAKASAPDPRPVPDRVYLAALVQADDDEALWIDLAAEHGLRRAEIACIHSRDISETLIGHDLRVHGKGGKTRYVPLTRAMARALLNLAERGGYLWPGDEAGHVSARWLGKRVNRLLEGAWTIHKLRHRAATRFWVAAEGDPYVVADLMGWANLSMVRRYVKLPDERRRAVVEAASRAGRPLAHA